MSFTDNFDTLNTDVWEVYNSIPSKGVVDIADGKLKLGAVNIVSNDGAHDIGIRTKNTLNLMKTQIEIPLEFIDPFSYLYMRFGIAVTNFPFAYYSGAHPYQKGFWIGLVGVGYQDAVLQIWEIVQGTGVQIFWREGFGSHPELLRIKIGEKGVYFYEVINGEEWFLHNMLVNIDFSNCYLAIVLMADSADPIHAGSSGVLIDYVKATPYDVAESVPYQRFGETLTPPQLPPEVVYPLIGNMIPIFTANAMITLAEMFKK